MFKIREGFYTTVEDGNILNLLDNVTKTTNKRITYYNDVVAFDIETTSFIDQDIEESYQDEIIYNHLKGVKIKIDDSIYKEFPDFNLIRRALFGQLYFSKIDGISIDSLYHELVTEFPYAFDEDIYNKYDQLSRIIEVFEENKPGKHEEDNKRALMYVWQIAINGTVVIGRTWQQFVELINNISNKLNLSKDRRLIIWVHNLAFEFQFLKDYFSWEKVFAISTRKPIYALTSTGVEFRCSYILSNLSLNNVGLSLQKYHIKKLVGDLDYEKLRHEKTPLTEKEIAYCCNDVLVVSAYIKERMEEVSDDITRLPLTATGYCRIFTKNNCLGHKDSRQFRSFRKKIDRLTISGMEEMNLMQRAFAGGFTHTGALHSCQVLRNVSSFDLTSAYPFALVSQKYPMSRGRKIKVKTIEELKHYCKLYWCLFDIKFKNIRPKVINENYISVSKCWEIKNPVTNNGRLVGADEIAISICSTDMEIISRFYTWESAAIGDFYIYKLDYLPRELIMSILKLYSDKTKLKGVKGQEDFYTKSKQLLNSIYGMMVTTIIMPLHEYKDNEGWTVTKKDIEKELIRYNNSKKRFLFYPWGIACTAYTRRTVASAILAFGDDYIYSDTDSIKAINANKHMDYINRYNSLVKNQLQKVADHYDIPFDMFAPKTIKGEVKMLGVWDNETPKPWKAFKSLGAKRYMILTHDNELTITVSGVNKKYAAPYLVKKYGKIGAFCAFNNSLVIPEDHTGKLTHYYLDSGYSGTICDYLGNEINYNCKSGIYLEKASYSFSMEEAYLNYLRQLRGEIFA